MHVNKPYILFFIGLALTLTVVSCNRAVGEGDGEESHEVHGDEVTLSQAQMDAVGIKLGRMEPREMGELLSTTGSLEVSAANEAVITPRLSGKITRILVEPGKRVAAGQTVAYVEVPEIAVLRQDYRIALEEMAGARKEYERQQALSEQGAGVRKNLEAARSALSVAELKADGYRNRLLTYGASLDSESSTIAVKADISGTVVSVDGVTGDYTDPQTPLARIVDTDAVYCLLNVVEKDISLIKKGMDVEIRLTNNPSCRFGGKVADVNPVVDSSTRLIPVKVTLSGERPDCTLIPGMAVGAVIKAGTAMVSSLPEEAVVGKAGRSYIFVLEDEEEEDHDHEGEKEEEYHFRKVEVVTGDRSMGYVAVTPVEPLDPDASIVVAGAFYLNSMSTEHGEHNH